MNIDQRQLWTLELTRFYTDMAETLILPSFAAIALWLMIPKALLQYTIPAYLIGKVLIQLAMLSGYVEKHDKKKALMLLMSLSIVGSFIELIPDIHWIIAGRFVQGLGVGCFTSIATDIVKNNIQGTFLKNWTMIGLVNIWAPLAGAFLGGFIQIHYGWQANFVYIIVFAVVCLSLIGRYVPHTIISPASINQSPFSISAFLASPFLTGEMLSYCLIYGGQAIIYTLTPLWFLEVCHWPENIYWIVLLFFSGGLFTGKMLAYRFAALIQDSYGKGIIILVPLLASISLIIADQLHFFVVACSLMVITLFGFAQSALSPLVRDDISSHFTGHLTSATALFSLLAALSGAFLSFIAASYFKSEPQDMGWALLTISTLALIIFLLCTAYQSLKPAN